MAAEDQKTIDTLMELKHLLQTENEHLYQQYNHLLIRNQKLMKRIDDQQQLNDMLQGRIAGLEKIIDRMRRNFDNAPTGPGIQNPDDNFIKKVAPDVESLKASIDTKELISRWESVAGETVKNLPTKKRQMHILSLLYQNNMSGMNLFIACGITGVSGARYISALKQFGLIEYSGSRKDGHYHITEKGKKLVEGERGL